jgi:hypothetical protein
MTLKKYEASNPFQSKVFVKREVINWAFKLICLELQKMGHNKNNF